MKKQLSQNILLVAVSFLVYCNPTGTASEKKEAENTHSSAISVTVADSASKILYKVGVFLIGTSCSGCF
jgi:hypothetical protein